MLDALTGMAATRPIPAVLRGEQIPQWSPEMETTVKRFHHDSQDQLCRHLQDVIDAYNFGRGLKTLKGLTPTNSSASSGIRRLRLLVPIFISKMSKSM